MTQIAPLQLTSLTVQRLLITAVQKIWKHWTRGLNLHMGTSCAPPLVGPVQLVHTFFLSILRHTLLFHPIHVDLIFLRVVVSGVSPVYVRLTAVFSSKLPSIHEEMKAADIFCTALGSKLKINCNAFLAGSYSVDGEVASAAGKVSRRLLQNYGYDGYDGPDDYGVGGPGNDDYGGGGPGKDSYYNGGGDLEDLYAKIGEEIEYEYSFTAMVREGTNAGDVTPLVDSMKFEDTFLIALKAAGKFVPFDVFVTYGILFFGVVLLWRNA